MFLINNRVSDNLKTNTNLIFRIKNFLKTIICHLIFPSVFPFGYSPGNHSVAQHQTNNFLLSLMLLSVLETSGEQTLSKAIYSENDIS